MSQVEKLRYLFLSFLTILILLNLPGCTNRREIDKLGMLGAIGVDLQDNKIVLTMELAKPSSPGKKQGDLKPVVIVQASGNSFFEALRDATAKIDRKIFLSTSRIMVISEEAARQGLNNLLDFWMRDHEARGFDYLLIARNCDASEIIGMGGGISDTPSQYLEALVKADKAASKTVKKRITQYVKDYNADGLQPTIGIIYKTTKVQSQNKQKNTQNNQEDSELFLEGCAVFHEDKMVGTLDGTETRALNFMRGEMVSAIILAPIEEGQAPSSVEIMNSTSKLDVEYLNNDRVLLTAKITIDGMLGEQPADVDLRDPPIMKKLEESFSQVVKAQLEATIRKSQQDYGLDIFGFGEAFHRKYPQQWKNLKVDWDKTFASADISVQVNTNISRSGLTDQPIQRKTE